MGNLKAFPYSLDIHIDIKTENINQGILFTALILHKITGKTF